MGFKTVAAFCREYKFSQMQIGKYENFQDYPKRKDLIERLEKAFFCSIEELFPIEYKQAVDMKLGKNILETSVETDCFLPGIDNVGLLPSPIEIYEKVELKENLEKALCTLTEREAQVLISRYGLDEKGEHMLREIGEMLHLTTERIRQIEAKALRKLKYLYIKS